MDKNQAAWMKFLKPVAVGLVVFLSVAAGYLQYLQTGKNDKLESRVTALETRADATDKRSDKFGSEIDNFRLILGDIRSDVAYIRGKMEAVK